MKMKLKSKLESDEGRRLGFEILQINLISFNGFSWYWNKTERDWVHEKNFSASLSITHVVGFCFWHFVGFWTGSSRKFADIFFLSLSLISDNWWTVVVWQSSLGEAVNYAGKFPATKNYHMNFLSPHYIATLLCEERWERTKEEENQLKIKYLRMNAELSTTANLISSLLKLIYFLRIFLVLSSACISFLVLERCWRVHAQNLNITEANGEGFQTKNYAEMIIFQKQ